MRRRILLVGSTLTLESIGAVLAGDPHIDLRRAAAVPDLWPDDFVPDAILFDVSDGIPDCAHACLAAHNDLLMLGFDLESHQVLLLSGAPAGLSTMADLTQILATAAGSAQAPASQTAAG